MNSNIVFGILIIFIIVCLVVLFSAILLKKYLSKIKIHNQVLYQKEIDQEKAINRTIFEVQEDTLNKISEELHDDAGQKLTYINFFLENLKLSNPEFYSNILPVSESIRDLSHSIRNLSHTINSQKLKNYKLIDNIIREIERINKLKIVSCELVISKDLQINFSTEDSIILFRIFQEILNNVLKHSKASKFILSISKTPNVLFTFKDNGIGFSLDEITGKTTQGLDNIKNRAALINFNCEIFPNKNNGTLIKLQSFG